MSSSSHKPHHIIYEFEYGDDAHKPKLRPDDVITDDPQDDVPEDDETHPGKGRSVDAKTPLTKATKVNQSGNNLAYVNILIYLLTM